jgi:hypothetical protein
MLLQIFNSDGEIRTERFAIVRPSRFGDVRDKLGFLEITLFKFPDTEGEPFDICAEDLYKIKYPKVFL